MQSAIRRFQSQPRRPARDHLPAIIGGSKHPLIEAVA